MFFFTGFNRSLAACGMAATMTCTAAVHAAMDPRFELDTQALEGSQSSQKSPRKHEKRITHKRTGKLGNGHAQGTFYIVKQGDHLFKILMRDYGLSNDEAEAFIEEIRRENNIYDIKKLRVGQKISIPRVRRKSDGNLVLGRHLKELPAQTNSDDGVTSVSGQTFRLESTVPALSNQEAAALVKDVWDKMLPSKGEVQKPLTIQSPTFSLTLDSQRYPVFAAMDGSRILLDQDASIPPLVKALIQEKDPTVRIVSESPVNGRRFLAAMLGAAGFYSVEENFSMEFGVDPKLMVRSDFKVEKTPESIMKQEVSLLNSGRSALPTPLTEFLKKEGFTVYEPFASQTPFLGDASSRQIYQITGKKQPEIVDAILKTLEVPYQNDRRLDVFAAENNGISLSVKAERFFERDGQRVVITRFDGDPVTYSLFRILETKGYRVVILENQDDFRKISEKILSRLNIHGGYAQHKLWPDDASNYTLQMSGFKLEGSGVPGGSMFLTNLRMDRIIRDLLVENGYSIHDK